MASLFQLGNRILCLNLVLLATLAFLLPHGTTAAEFTVGDENGWATGTNYLAWSQKYNFTVGDVLVFQYVAGQHDVFEVTEGTFRSCNSSSGVIKTYAGGGDRVTLEEARRYWFICNTSGHCLGGMKFGISVGAASSPEVPPGGVFGSPPPPPMESAAVGGVGGCRWWVAVGLLQLVSSIMAVGRSGWIGGVD